MAKPASKSKREKQLEQKLAAARTKRKTREMVAILEELESLRPDEPRHPHQLGDAWRALGRVDEAAKAYERAVRNYAESGFLARAMAMAKTLLSVAPDRADILEQLEPQKAQEIHRRQQLQLQNPNQRSPNELLDLLPRKRGANSSTPPPAPEPSTPPDHAQKLPQQRFHSAPTMALSNPDESALNRRLAPESGDRGLVRPGLDIDTSTSTSTPPTSGGGQPHRDRTAQAKTPAGRQPPPPPQPKARTRSQPPPRPQAPASDPLPASFGPEIETDFDVSLSGADFNIEEVCDDILQNPAPSADHLAMLPLFPLFSEIPQQAMMSLAKSADLVRLTDGEVVIRRGDPADGLFGIVEGAVRVLVPGHESKKDIILTEGHVFGESCLLHGGPRSADVVVKGQLLALHFPKSVLTELISVHPRVNSVLMSMLSKRLLANLLMSSPLFTPFDMSTRVQISRMFKVMRARQGATIFNNEAGASGLCIPLTGNVDLAAPDGTKQRQMGPGEAFGQESLLGASVGHYEAKATNDIIYLHLPAHQFTELAMQYPPFLESLSTMIPAPGLAI